MDTSFSPASRYHTIYQLVFYNLWNCTKKFKGFPTYWSESLLLIYIKILSSFSQAYGIIILNQNLLPNVGENMEFLEDRDQMNAILWSIIIAGMCVILVEMYYLRNTSVSDTFLDWKIAVTIVAGIVGAVVHYFYIHMIIPYNS